MTWLAALLLLAPFEPPTPAACAGRRDVALRAPDVTVVCKHGVEGCSAEATIVIDNCSGEPVELARLVLRPAAGATIWDLDRSAFVVPIGQQRVLRRPIYGRAGRMTIEATLVGRLDPLRARVRVRVTNPALDAAIAACRACRGQWGAHGMTSALGCVCRANAHRRRGCVVNTRHWR